MTVELAGLTDTLARSAHAIAELDDAIRHIDIEYRDGDEQRRVYAYRCNHCPDVHVQLTSTGFWDRDEADTRLYGDDVQSSEPVDGGQAETEAA